MKSQLYGSSRNENAGMRNTPRPVRSALRHGANILAGLRGQGNAQNAAEDGQRSVAIRRCSFRTIESAGDLSLRSRIVNARTLVIVALSTLLGGCAATPKDADPARVPRAGRIMPIAADRPLIGIALGGGGARGVAHVGVIKAREKA